ncbi:MAG: ATP-binding protein [Armatimonadota bacterium]
MYSVPLVLIATAVYDLILAGLVLANTRTHQAGRSFAWYLLGIAGWTSCCAAILFPGFGPGTTIALARACFAFATVTMFGWLYFCAEFPHPSRPFRLVAWVSILLGIPLLFLGLSDRVVTGVSGPPWYAHVTVGPSIHLFTIWLVIAMLATATHLVMKSRRLRGMERLQVLYIILGTMLTVAVGVLVNLVLPFFTHSTHFAYLGPLSSLFITSATTYAIVRYRLMDITVVLRTSLIYATTGLILLIYFAAFVPVLDFLLYKLTPTATNLGSFIMAFVMVLIFQPVQQRVQFFFDKYFFTNFDSQYRASLQEASNALTSAFDRIQLVEILTKVMIRTVTPASATVFLRMNEDLLMQATIWGKFRYLPSQIYLSELAFSTVMNEDEVILAEECARRSEPYRGIGEQLQAWDAYVAVPLIAGGQISGVVFLGEKRNGYVYTSDDIGLMRILAKQAAIALENVHHYDEALLMNEYHERLLHIMQDGVIALDPKGDITTFNPVAERITGISMLLAQKRSLHDIGLPHLPVQSGQVKNWETTITSRSGQEVPVLVSITPFRRRGDIETSHLIILHDISNLRELERERMQAERFSSMGALAASLATDLKEPLDSIQQFADRLQQQYDDTDFRQEFSETVLTEVNQINSLISQVLDLVRKPSHDRGLVNIREAFERLLLILQPECERNQITVHTVFTGDLPSVVGVAGQLYQAILNVLTNAVQSMPNGGDLDIRVEGTTERLVCRIIDHGPPISQEDSLHLFDPRFIGGPERSWVNMALAYEFIRSHGGDISAEIRPDSGLTITFSLPAWRYNEAGLVYSNG